MDGIFYLAIELGNAAFDDPTLDDQASGGNEARPEIVRILRAAADAIENGATLQSDASGLLRDINGNTVGRFSISERSCSSWVTLDALTKGWK